MSGVEGKGEERRRERVAYHICESNRRYLAVVLVVAKDEWFRSGKSGRERKVGLTSANAAI